MTDSQKRAEGVVGRYWVNCPHPLYSGIDPTHYTEEQLEGFKAAEKKLEGEFSDSEYGFVFKTWDLEEARRKVKFARDVLEEAGIHLHSHIVAQPVCSKCGGLGRSPNPFCSSCGVPLRGGGYVE